MALLEEALRLSIHRRIDDYRQRQPGTATPLPVRSQLAASTAAANIATNTVANTDTAALQQRVNCLQQSFAEVVRGRGRRNEAAFAGHPSRTRRMQKLKTYARVEKQENVPKKTAVVRTTHSPQEAREDMNDRINYVVAMRRLIKADS